MTGAAGGHATPAEAALAEFGHRSPHVLGTTVAPDGERAFVLLGSDRPPFPYWGEALRLRRHPAGGWEIETSRRFGAGGAIGGADDEVAPDDLVGLALPAPEGATAAVVGHAGGEHRVPVVAPGWAFFAAWTAGRAAEPPALLRWE